MLKAKCSIKTILPILILFLIFSCSTTKVISEGESRLKSNVIKIENSKEFNASNLEPYLKQRPNTYFIFGWNPFLNVYNWSNGKDNGWNNFVKKIGQEPVVFDKDLISSSLSNMNNHLVYEGYYNSIIKDSVKTVNKKSTVFYNVKLGNRYTVDSVNYTIRDSSLADLFYADSLNHTIKKGKILSENLLNLESERIAQLFRNNGYFGFSKNCFFFEADTNSSNFTANLDIRLEDYSRNESPAEAKRHRVFNIRDVNISTVRNFTYTQEKEIYNYLTADTLLYNGLNIINVGRSIVRDKVLARMNMVEPGSTYNEQIINDTYNRYANMRFFSSVNIQMDEVDSTAVDCNIKLTTSKLQGYNLSLEASSTSSGLFGVAPSLSYYHKNLFRGGELFNVSFRGDFQFMFNNNISSNEFGVSSGLSIPNFLLLNDKLIRIQNMSRTELNLSYNFQKRPEYTRNIISASAGYTWNVKDKFYYKVYPVQVSIVKLDNLSKEFYDGLTDPFLLYSYQDHFDLGTTMSFYYTTDASMFPTKSYFKLNWINDISGNLLSLFNSTMKLNENGQREVWGSPYSQYFKTEANVVYTWIFGKKGNNSIATRFLAGVGTGYGNSKALPFEKLFWAGGAYSLRAWQARTVGPGSAQRDSSFTIPNQTGDMRLEANLEYRFPLFWNFDGALFLDAGNVWTLKRDYKSIDSDIEDLNLNGRFHWNNFYKNIATDWGVGVRLNLGFALLRLDMGMKLYDPSQGIWIAPNSWLKGSNYALQFGVGYPF